jgi:hypothetical protein
MNMVLHTLGLPVREKLQLLILVIGTGIATAAAKGPRGLEPPRDKGGNRPTIWAGIYGAAQGHEIGQTGADKHNVKRN